MPTCETAQQREESQDYPCSPGQRGLWAARQRDSGNPSHTIVARWRVEGEVSQTELGSALELIVRRHQALRMFFTTSPDGEPRQTVEPRLPFSVPLTDLSGAPESDVLATVERLALAEAQRPFDLASPPLLRMRQVRLSSQLSILLVTAHASVCDAWSLGILARECGSICAALKAGQVPDLPKLPISYGDLVIRTAARHTTATVGGDTAYWEQLLRGARPVEIQPDRPRSPVQAGRSDSQSVLLERGLTRPLAELSSRNDCTIVTAGLATLLTLLHRYTGESDIAIGYQVSGRDDPRLTNLVGPLSSALVVRSDLSGDPSFVTVLARVRASLAATHEHEHVAPETLIGIVHGAGSASRQPAFFVHWACRQSVEDDPAHGAVRVLEVPSHALASCDLEFSMTEQAAGWRVSCEFNAAMFNGSTVARLLRHFEQVVRAVVANPEQAISRLPVLDDAERRALVVECNQTAASYPQNLTMPELFAVQVARQPEALAVVCGEQTMTYAELDAASSRLAHELRSRGVAPATRIAVILDRSPDLIVALLAVLKAGSAYVPLDPAYPEERLAHVFENSRPAAIITRASLVGRLPPGAVPVIQVDVDSAAIARQSATAPDGGPSPADLAYVIYTSGSTGRPKGVQIQHRALVNLLWAMRRQPGMTDRDRLAGVTTISFDMAVPDVFLPLLVGARLILAREEEMKSGDALLRLLRTQGVTIMQATPVTWQLLLEAGWRGDPSLRMLCGGEAMPRKLAESLLESGGELWNMYGPTETTVWSSAVRVESGDGPVPIGPPIANTQFYVLDAHGELVPPGAPGELFIGGDGVGLGYFGLPEATRDRFVADRFGSDPQARLYRTGDVVRMRQNESRGYWIEFLGRADHQVKLRGFRIELGEIEAALLGHPALAEVVAVLGKDAVGEAAIWAYVVPARARAESSGKLIELLRGRLFQALPSYMHPASIVVLEALPRTPNGKIDRARLPAPVSTEGLSGTTVATNEVEQRVTRIWCLVLGLPVVDRSADFFEIGGHSLLAARLLSHINAEFGQQLSLATLFQAPTIEAQADLLGDGGPRKYDFRQVVQLQATGAKPPLIAIHNTGVYYYRLSSRLEPDQPLTALQLFDPSLTHEALPSRLEDIAAEYVRLIRQVHPTGPYQLIGWCVGGVVAYEVARQLTALKHEVSFLALIDAWAPGYLRRLPAVRAFLADQSFRWQLIATDWRRTMAQEQSLTAFLSNRTVVKKVLRWVGKPVADRAPPVSFEGRGLSPENYDQWLLGYFEEAERRYQPGAFAGRVTLLRSALEPQGPFLDPKMGWGVITSGVIDVVVMDGDHFTVFEGQGLEQMASKVSAALATCAARVPTGSRRAAVAGDLVLE